MNALLLMLFVTLLFIWLMRSPGSLGGCGLHHGDRHLDHGRGVDAAEPGRHDAAKRVAQKLSTVFRPREVSAVNDAFLVRGDLLADRSVAYDALSASAAGTGFVPLLQEDAENRPVLLLVAEGATDAPAGRSRPLLHLGLLVATVVTTTWAGAAHHGVSLLAEPARFVEGLPYALSLMAILGAHELGHYFTARRYRMRVTLPYFIPVPFGLGTFGAFIQLKSPPRDRRAMFDVGVAGPMAGLVLAIPALFIGLRWSSFASATSGSLAGTDVGSSFLLALMTKLSLGVAAAEGHRLVLHPLAFAGWLGLMITALNLLPIGQLDGGHMAHALLGRNRAGTLGGAALFALFVLGIFVWNGFLTWALVVYFIAGTKSSPPLDDIAPLDRGRIALALAAYALLVLILTPVPRALYASLALHSPYL